ncbi:hypothetical protein ZIOFF_003103 [Zingiber officinale]|uniref:Myb/SANT-like domain-containing protein n=1 Tax=Zingiber officinale TaxID=94328 RepID=A0A8J5ICP2_ZINOF|nr:hypothetical protein ZIOFF_003103 [Zingiber officinale]
MESNPEESVGKNVARGRDGGFKNSYMVEIRKIVIQKLLPFTKYISYIESKIKTLKRKFHAINEMCRQSDCTWNDVEKKIAYEETWYLKWIKRRHFVLGKSSLVSKEIEHLPDVGGVPVRVEEGGGRLGVPQLHRHDLVAPPRREAQDVRVVAARDCDTGNGEPPAPLVGDHIVGGRARREEGKLGGDRGRNSAHLSRLPRFEIINGPEGDEAPSVAVGRAVQEAGATRGRRRCVYRSRSASPGPATCTTWRICEGTPLPKQQRGAVPPHSASIITQERAGVQRHLQCVILLQSMVSHKAHIIRVISCSAVDRSDVKSCADRLLARSFSLPNPQFRMRVNVPVIWIIE